MSYPITIQRKTHRIDPNEADVLYYKWKKKRWPRKTKKKLKKIYDLVPNPGIHGWMALKDTKQR